MLDSEYTSTVEPRRCAIAQMWNMRNEEKMISSVLA